MARLMNWITNIVMAATCYILKLVYITNVAQKKGGGSWFAGCAGTGDWEEDKANGDYAQATFSKLVVGPSTPPS